MNFVISLKAQEVMRKKLWISKQVQQLWVLFFKEVLYLQSIQEQQWGISSLLKQSGKSSKLATKNWLQLQVVLQTVSIGKPGYLNK